MKKDIHPTYHKDAKVVCACGNTFTTGSTLKEIHTEICSECHPFYTGKENIIDTAGRVDKFKSRAQKTHKLKESRAETEKSKESKKGAQIGNQEKLEKIRKALNEK